LVFGAEKPVDSLTVDTLLCDNMIFFNGYCCLQKTLIIYSKSEMISNCFLMRANNSYNNKEQLGFKLLTNLRLVTVIVFDIMRKEENNRHIDGLVGLEYLQSDAMAATCPDKRPPATITTVQPHGRNK